MIKHKPSHLDSSAKEEIDMKRQLINRIKVHVVLVRPITGKNYLSLTRKLLICRPPENKKHTHQHKLKSSLNLQRILIVLTETQESVILTRCSSKKSLKTILTIVKSIWKKRERDARVQQSQKNKRHKIQIQGKLSITMNKKFFRMRVASISTGTPVICKQPISR